MISNYLFLVASAREPGCVGNTEFLARRAARYLSPDARQTWLHLAQLNIPAFVDKRHTTGFYPPPTGDLELLLQSTIEHTHIVLVAPVYWYSFPAALKAYLDHWSAWRMMPSLAFEKAMRTKTLSVIATSATEQAAYPMIESARVSANFLSMRFAGALWGKGGPPGTVQGDDVALARARSFLAKLHRLESR